MPSSIAEYLRHLATRCSRIGRDTRDTMVTKELEIISVELVEKAAELEAIYAMPGPPSAADTAVCAADDDEAK
jgi:uncharacterized protein YabN with tetrapyrrole methylase and pyrophosphatase domain